MLKDHTEYSWVLVVATATVTAIVASSRLLFSDKNGKDTKKLPPRCTDSFLTIAKSLGGNDAPWFMYRLVRRYKSKVVRLSIPMKGTLWVITDYKLQRKILTHPTVNKAVAIYKTFEGVTNFIPAMFTRSTLDPLWREVRKTTAHAFSSNEVNRMNDICSQHVDVWMENVLETPLLKQQKQDGVEEGVCFDPSLAMIRVVFGSLVESAYEYKPTDEEFHTTHEALEILLKEYFSRQLANPLRQPFWFLFPETRKAMSSAKTVNAFCKKMLHEHRLKRTSAASGNDKSSSSKSLVQLIDKTSLSDDEKISEMTSFLGAGHDTTSFTLSTILVLLAKHPNEQAKVRESYKKQQHNGANGKLAVTDELQRVILEARRLLPVGALGSIRVLKDAIEDDDEYGTIPAGVMLFLPQLAMLRDPDVFVNNPDEFLPDRWIEPVPQPMKDSLMSFAVGSRNCIGQSLAMAELNSILPKLLSRYTFSIEKPGELDYFLTLHYAGCILRATKNSE